MRASILCLSTLLVVSIGTSVTSPAAANEIPDRAVTGTAAYSRAAVVLDGETLFHVHGITDFPADRRAEDISARIRGIAEDDSVAVDSVHAVELPDRTNLLAADRPIMSVLETDATLEGVSRQELTDIVRIRTTEALARYRYNRSPRVLLINTLYAFVATAAFAGLLVGVRRGFRWLRTALGRRLKARIDMLQAESRNIIQANLIWNLLEGVLNGLQLFAVLVSAYLYVNLVLGLYPWTSYYSGKLLAIFVAPLKVIGTGVLAAIPDLVFIAILALVVRYLLRIMRLFFISVERGTIRPMNFEPDWALPTYKVARFVVIAFALVMAYPYIPGSDSEAFKGISLLLGLLLSLGSSSYIANLIAGYTVLFRRAFKQGDRIRIGDITGYVTETRLLVTHLRSPKNEEITIPNSTIMNSEVVNYSKLARSHGLILHTSVGIGYETPWRQVEALLKLAAERTPLLLREPPPYVLQKALGDFSVTYELNVYCDDAYEMNQHYTALHRNILDVFNEYGVQVMTPAYESDPGQPKIVPQERWFASPAVPATDAGSNQRSS